MQLAHTYPICNVLLFSYIYYLISFAAPNQPVLTAVPVYNLFGHLLEIVSQATEGVSVISKLIAGTYSRMLICTCEPKTS